jgi:hypothetical protein
MNFQKALSASALLALYTAFACATGNGFDVTLHASLIWASFQVEASSVKGELATEAATLLEVYTKLFTDGSLAADWSRVVTPATVGGITSLGSGLKDTFDAVWITPWTPRHKKYKLGPTKLEVEGYAHYL